MKILKKIINQNLFFFIIIFFWFSTSHAYLFWLKSADNSIYNIKQIEKEQKIQIPMLSYIFDPRNEYSQSIVDWLAKSFWTWKIYHITIPPTWTAKEVANWSYDKEYLDFFQRIKKQWILVIFRTMHEMNGGRYPWSSDPENFKKARIHVRNLSRKAWLTNEQIAFDFSVNHVDMPTNDPYPTQSSKLIECTPASKITKNCYTFEDYYPWNSYVDVVWFTFYNWWKATSNRLWLTPYQILYDKRRQTLDRIKLLWKPIIIDEVWTTAVYYTWDYKPEKSLEIYQNEYTRKNVWLNQLKGFLNSEKLILWVIYFNVDYTYWLENPYKWEADRAIFNIEKNKTYYGWLDLVAWWEKLEKSQIYSIFGLKNYNINGKNILVKIKYYEPLKNYLTTLLTKYQNKSELIQFLQSTKSQTTNTELIYMIDKIFEIIN